MQAYWNMLEWKRKQLEKEQREQMAGQAVRTTLPQSIRHIQLDLRDLMSQVSSQVSSLLTKIHMLFVPLLAHTNTLEEVTPRSDKKTVSLSSPDDLHAELLDEADLSCGTDTLEPSNQLQNSVGQPSGGLHHFEGSRPLPHQAGKGLPPAGFKSRRMTQRCKKKSAETSTTHTGKRKKKAELKIST